MKAIKWLIRHIDAMIMLFAIATDKQFQAEMEEEMRHEKESS